MKFRNQAKPITSFSLASLTDIVMLLLIFFLLSSAYIIQPGIKVQLPSSDTAQVIEEKNVIISIARDGTVYIGNDRSNVSALAADLRRHIVSGAMQTIVIKADKSIKVEMLVSVIDRIKAAGGERFLIATEREGLMTAVGEKRLGWGLSIWLHIMLALAFFALKFDLLPFELDYTPISFMPSSAPEVGGALIPTIGGAQPLVELPKRPMLEDESPLLKLPKPEKQTHDALVPDQRPDLRAFESISSGRRVELETDAKGSRARADIKPMQISDDLLRGSVPDDLSEKIAGDEAFAIQWEGEPRTKISGQLPDYPSGAQAAKVKINFEVAPDGNVIYASLSTKGQPDLDRVSLETIRKWRFNPLDPAEQQVKQKGTVTFIYELK